ncbi:MAG TPA: class I SAM-dependent methyltransferase [Nannocystis exedens]|nr:class I SAM-dependent methyltransferase [Nannocystis exedens]
MDLRESFAHSRQEILCRHSLFTTCVFALIASIPCRLGKNMRYGPMPSRRQRLKTWYERRVLAGILDGAMAGVQDLRAELLPNACGRVIEIGFGTGANLPYYGEGLSSLIAVEPSRVLAQIARERLEQWGRPFELIESSGSRRLPIADASVDTAILTFVLCSVRRVPELLAELGRVLKPGGSVVIAEHVAAAKGPQAAAQRAIRPLWRACLGGCDPARNTLELLNTAGYDTRELSLRPLGLPWIVRPGLIGIARSPADHVAT